MARFTTHIQEIAVSCVFAVMGESRFNRTQAEYRDIAKRMPPLKVLLPMVNEYLQKLHESEGANLPQICRFNAGHKIIRFEPYPKSVSAQTLRTALNLSGMRAARGRELSF